MPFARVGPRTSGSPASTVRSRTTTVRRGGARRPALVIVRAKTRGEFKDVWLECAGNLTTFQPVGTRGDYEWARVDLARGGGPGETFGTSVCRNGLQRMKSEGPFSATLWGWARFASYAYPGGLALRKLVETPLSPIN